MASVIGMKRWLRKLGQNLGLIYRDDGTWGFGSLRLHTTKSLPPKKL